jgi:hypothetical protein
MITPLWVDRFISHARMALVLSAVSIPALAQDAAAPAATWAFNPGKDAFSADALLDLRSLNEDVAGAAGFVHVDASGQLVLGDGKPARFWAVNSDVGKDKVFKATPLGPQEAPSLETHARFLAKRGVNMVRLFALVTPHPDQTLDQPQEDIIDWMQRGVAAMKKAGIYTTLCPYWSAAAQIGPAWGLDDNGGAPAFGLLFFDPKLQEAYKGWWKKILTNPNPYTGIPLGQDPAVAILQLQDEDSLLFWTFATIKGKQKANLAKLFGDFLAKEYGSVQNALSAWSDEKLPLDDASAGTADFRNLYELTQPRPQGGRQKRLTDQLRFFTETMSSFNKMMGDYIHNDLGCKQLVNANSWITADNILLNDAERYSYEPNEVMAVNRYFGGIHQGPNNGWAIMNGDQFTNPSILTDPREFPVSLKQVPGKPMIITESSWTFPNGRAAEAPFLVAAYSSLNGMQGYYWFVARNEQWGQPQSANGYIPSAMKWFFESPDMLGTFPAAALMYRKGYVKKGEPAVVEQRALNDIYTGTSPIIAESATFDPNRQKGAFAVQNNIPNGVDPLAFLVGPVEAIYGGDPGKSQVVDLTKYIDPATKTVQSDTGELSFNYDTGYCTVNTPCAQGATAFFSKHPSFSLPTVDLTSHNEHGSVLVVSLDGQPIAHSAKVLVQVGMGCRPTGWKETPTQFTADGKTVDGFTVANFGGPPWQINSADVSLTIRNPGLKKASVLDPNGNVTGSVDLKASTDGIQFTFPPNALYVVLQAE